MGTKRMIGPLIFFMLLDLISFQALATPITTIDKISTYNSTHANNINLETRQDDEDRRVIQVQIPEGDYTCLDAVSYNPDDELDYQHITRFIDGYDPNRYFGLGDLMYAYQYKEYGFMVSKEYFTPPNSDQGVCAGDSIRTDQNLKADFSFKDNWWVANSNFHPRQDNDYRIIQVQIPDGNYQCLRAVSIDQVNGKIDIITLFIDGYDVNRYYCLGSLMYADINKEYAFMVSTEYYLAPGWPHGYCRGANLETMLLKPDFTSFRANWWLASSNFKSL